METAKPESDLSSDRRGIRPAVREIAGKDVIGSGGSECEYRVGKGGKRAGMPAMRSGIGTEREKEPKNPNPRRARGRVRERIWNLSEVRTRDFSPWMKNWN